MPKLPVCPHCGTIYRYKDVNALIHKKRAICYHCKESFEVKRKKFLILFLEIALFCAIFDVVSLYMGAVSNFVFLVVSNAVIICLGLLLRPWFVRFEK